MEDSKGKLEFVFNIPRCPNYDDYKKNWNWEYIK